MDGEISHHDTTVEAGSSARRDPVDDRRRRDPCTTNCPHERAYRRGGPFHAVQLWVNLPRSLKFAARYQAITRDNLTLLTSHDGGALLRLVAGGLASHQGPGVTHTPITTSTRRSRRGGVERAWSPDFSAFAYVLTGQGAGRPRRNVSSVMTISWCSAGRQRHVVRAAERMSGGGTPLDVLLLGGLPIRERSPLRTVRDEHPRRDRSSDRRLPIPARLGVHPADPTRPPNLLLRSVVMTRIGVILGSTRPGRRGAQVAEWVMEHTKNRTDASRAGGSRRLPLPHLDEPLPPSWGSTRTSTRTSGPRGSLGTTGSSSSHRSTTTRVGVLKNAIDYLYAEWNNRRWGVVSYGRSRCPRCEHLRLIRRRAPDGRRPPPTSRCRCSPTSSTSPTCSPATTRCRRLNADGPGHRVEHGAGAAREVRQAA